MNTIKRFVAAFKAASTVAFPRATSYIFGWNEVGGSEYARVVGDGLDSNVLVAPLLWIARAFPEAPLAVRSEDSKGKKTTIRQHPMVKLIARPNAHYSGDALWFGLLISYLTDGNAYMAKVRGARGQVAELWYLPHWMVEPVGSDTEFIARYEYKPGHVTQKFAASEIVHFRMGLDPRNPRKGFSMLKALITSLFSDEEATNLTAAILKNRGIPGMVISPEKDVVLSGEDETALKHAVIEKTTGTQRGKPLIVSAAVKVSTFGFSPSELDLSATHNVSEERVSAMLGLPSAIVGFGSGNEATHVGATLRELVKLAWTGCLLPMQRIFAGEITRSLLPDFDKNENLSAFFDASEVEALQPNRLELAQACRAEFEGGIATRGEARGKLGYDVTPADDVFAVPFNITLTDRKEGVTPPDPTPLQDPLALPAPAGGAKGAKRLTRLQARILRARDESFKRLSAAFEKKVTVVLERYGEVAERAYLNSAKGAEDFLRVETIFSSMDLPKIRQDMRALFGAHYVSVHNDNMGTLAGMGVGVNLPDSVQVEILSQGGTRAGLVDLTDSARSRALRIIEQGREQGLGVEEVARQLRSAIPAGRFESVDTRARMIARNETRFAQTQSSLRAYRTIDGVDRVLMIDGRLGNTDEECEDMNGTPATFAEAERYLAAEHPNGTRDLVPMFGQEN